MTSRAALSGTGARHVANLGRGVGVIPRDTNHPRKGNNHVQHHPYAPLAAVAVAAGLLLAAAGPAAASSKLPTQETHSTALPVTMEDILVTSVATGAQHGASTKRARHHGRPRGGGNGGGVTASYDVRDQPRV